MKKSSKEILFERMHIIGGMPLNESISEDTIPMDEAGKANQFKVTIGGDSFKMVGDYIEILDKVFNKAKDIINSSDITIKDISIKPIGFANTNEDQEYSQEGIDDGNQYEEAPSYQVKLMNVVRDAKEIHDVLGSIDELPAWVQDKITIAEHNMDAVKGYYESKLHKNHKYSSDGEEI